LWRRPKPKLGCGAKERRRIMKIMNTNSLYLVFERNLLGVKLW